MKAQTCNEVELLEKGYAIIDGVFNCDEIDCILDAIYSVDTSKSTFRKTNDLFAIRQFLKEIPAVLPLILNRQLVSIINEQFGSDYFIVKAIYFDKPGASNWFVPYHQDLTISVSQKADMQGFGPWSVKQDQFAVQPPVDILQNNFTVRIHLDEADEKNGNVIVKGSEINLVV